MSSPETMSRDDDAILLALEGQFNAVMAELLAAQRANGEFAVGPNRRSLVQDTVQSCAGKDADREHMHSDTLRAFGVMLGPTVQFETVSVGSLASTILGHSAQYEFVRVRASRAGHSGHLQAPAAASAKRTLSQQRIVAVVLASVHSVAMLSNRSKPNLREKLKAESAANAHLLKPSTQVGVRSQGLFPCEEEIARRLSQERSRWRAIVIILERHGLPRIDPVMGGRYWPAVLAWWNRRYGLTKIEPSQPDGEEDLNAL